MSLAAPGAVTGVYAGLTGLLAIALAARVVGLRRRWRVGIGDGGQPELARAVRAHGNLVEYAPLALLLLLIAELSAALPPAGVHAAGSAFFLGRLLHAAGLSRSAGTSPERFLGSLLSWAAVVALAATLLVRGLAAAVG